MVDSDRACGLDNFYFILIGKEKLSTEENMGTNQTDSGRKRVAKFDSFEASERAQRVYYRSLTGDQRLDLLLELVKQYREALGEADERLARVHRVTELAPR